MFTRARLRLTLLYAALLTVTVVLVAGAIGLLAVQDARSTADHELQIRAAAVATALTQIPTGPIDRGPDPYRGSGNFGPPRGPGDRGPHLEEQGLLEYTLPVGSGQLVPQPASTLPGLPSITAAQQAMQSGTGRFTTVTVQGSAVRVYSLPVTRGGQTVAVVQIARSRYFVNAAVARIALISLAAGLIGLLISGGAGYWLAGLTLHPIATALDRQRNFAADASHELRTPLTVMLTNAELLTRHPERTLASYQDVVEDIIAEIDRLSRLVADLLTLARADQGVATPARLPVDLSEIGHAVARQFAPVAAGKGLVLDAEIEPGVVVTGDQDRLQQLAIILVDNAVRYTAGGGVTIRVRHDGDDGMLAVCDTGPGIAPEHLPHVFERFYRTDAARSSEEGGTGLGLALAHWIVESHKGHIHVTSTPGEGSTFTVSLRSAGGRPHAVPHPVPSPSLASDGEGDPAAHRAGGGGLAG